MSDTGNKPRANGERGPLPRTNRPRPETAQRRARRGASAPEPVPETQRETVPGELPAKTTEPGIAPEPPRGDAALAEPPVRADAALAEPPVHPSGSRVIATAATESAEVLAERPTQLDTSRSAMATRKEGGTHPLKQVGLARADGSAALSTDEAGPSSSYIGYVIDGRYRIEGVLGRGGMGVVYRARHEVIDKLAAIKILLPTEDAEVVERFVNEARAATAIGNAHIVDTVDFGALPDGSTYFVMEYLEGRTLARMIKAEQFVELPRAIAIAKQIAEGMSAAHRAGIVHRDLKPENIFVCKQDGNDEFVKLLDFGIAKVQHAQNRITRAGTIFGTPHYMSPEQAAGTEVDPRTDIYSLGVILYEMLSGKVPFDAENPMGLLTQHMYTDPTPLTKLEAAPQAIPSALDAIVLKCLAKKQDERYDTMDDLAEDLDRVVRGEPPLALADLLARAEREQDRDLLATAKEGLRARPGGRRAPLVTATVGGAVVIVVSVLAIAFRGELPGENGREDAVAASAAPPGPAASASSAAESPGPLRRSVALVFSPIDAEVFHEGKNLGGMPVNVNVSPGEVVDVEIRREGFYPEKVRLDGARPVVIVRLTPIPGVRPAIPVPVGEPLEALRNKGADGGTSARIAAFLAAHRAELAARADAGAQKAPATPPLATASAPVAPASPATSAPSAPTDPPPLAPAPSAATPAPEPPPAPVPTASPEAPPHSEQPPVAPPLATPPELPGAPAQ
jgi:serine/threonine-protein kinase